MIVVSATCNDGKRKWNSFVLEVKEDYENLLVYDSTTINLIPATLTASTLVFPWSILQRATRVILLKIQAR